MTLWICKLTVDSGQVRLTIPRSLVRAKAFLNVGYVQLDDKHDGQLIIKGVKIDVEEAADRKIITDGEDR